MQTTHTQTDISISKKSEFQQKKTLEKKTKKTEHTLVGVFLFSLHNMLVLPCICLDWITRGYVAGFVGWGQELSIYLFRKTVERMWQRMCTERFDWIQANRNGRRTKTIEKKKEFKWTNMCNLPKLLPSSSSSLPLPSPPPPPSLPFISLERM